MGHALIVITTGYLPDSKYNLHWHLILRRYRNVDLCYPSREFFFRVLSLVTMVGHGGGRSTPSYSEVVADRSKGVKSHRFKKPTKLITEANNTEK